MKRDIQARLLTVENFGDETFLSEEVAINILQEAKNALIRCNLVEKNTNVFWEFLVFLVMQQNRGFGND